MFFAFETFPENWVQTLRRPIKPPDQTQKVMIGFEFKFATSKFENGCIIEDSTNNRNPNFSQMHLSLFDHQ